MIGMDASEEGREEMRGLLEKNKKKLLDSVDDYLKIRDDIDRETDGQLDDKQISELTFLRMKILDADMRSDDMAKQLIYKIPLLQEDMETLRDKAEDKLQEEKQKLDELKQ